MVWIFVQLYNCITLHITNEGEVKEICIVPFNSYPEIQLGGLCFDFTMVEPISMAGCSEANSFLANPLYVRVRPNEFSLRNVCYMCNYCFMILFTNPLQLLKPEVDTMANLKSKICLSTAVITMGSVFLTHVSSERDKVNHFLKTNCTHKTDSFHTGYKK